ncbi:MAG: RNA polymerase sigma factor [Lentisphaeria bacterium]|nr:RNA polymerase sigma factor [Lentisphaeria bacterium]
MSLFTPITVEQFEKMLHEQLPFLRRMSMRILRNAQDADDAIQNALVKGWMRRFFLRTPERLGSWISRILVNECYNLLRKRKRDRTDCMEELPDLPTQEQAAHDDTAELSQMEAAIASLPEIYRQTVQIALLSGLDATTAARKLGVNTNALYQRIHTAKQLLRKKMPHDGRNENQ